MKYKIVIILMLALLFTACNKAEVVPPSISKQKPKETVIWDSNSKPSISQQEYDNVMLAYVKSKYPQKVKEYKQRVKVRARKKLIKDNTLMLDNLMWQDNSDTKRVQRTWNGAKAYCRNLSFLEFTDWRLGTQGELKNLYNNKSKLKYFSIGYYWSSTTYEGSKNRAWIVPFWGGVVDDDDKSNSYYVRCVRDGQ